LPHVAHAARRVLTCEVKTRIDKGDHPDLAAPLRKLVETL
jgi:hypothetical protein